MAVKIFVLGLPGSGKSTAVRHMDTDAHDCQWKTECINDYMILYAMFQSDTARWQFSSTNYGGFDVLDLSVFDTALRKLEQKVLQLEHENSACPRQIIFIEFSRNDYCQALRHFTAPFLKDALFLFIRADISACKRRIQDRVIHQQTKDDHFVSDYIFDTYYNQEDGTYPILELNGQQDRNGDGYELDSKHILVVDNGMAISEEDFALHLEDAWTKIKPLAEQSIYASVP